LEVPPCLLIFTVGGDVAAAVEQPSGVNRLPGGARHQGCQVAAEHTGPAPPASVDGVRLGDQDPGQGIGREPDLALYACASGVSGSKWQDSGTGRDRDLEHDVALS